MNIIRPLSLKALAAFGETRDMESEHPDRISGKFVRLGGALVVGRAVAGELDEDGDIPMIRHDQLFGYLHNEQPECAKAREERGSEPLLEATVHDAGAITFYADEQPPRLVINNESAAFGRADDAGRQRTIEIAQLLVGDSVLVVGKDTPS